MCRALQVFVLKPVALATDHDTADVHDSDVVCGHTGGVNVWMTWGAAWPEPLRQQRDFSVWKAHPHHNPLTIVCYYMALVSATQ